MSIGQIKEDSIDKIMTTDEVSPLKDCRFTNKQVALTDMKDPNDRHLKVAQQWLLDKAGQKQNIDLPKAQLNV